MIRLAKKGVPHTKLITKALVGIREVEEMGEVVTIKLDEFELLMTPDRAQSLASQVFAKVRKIQDRELQKNQQPLPLSQEGGA